jgi:hypothetical protein
VTDAIIPVSHQSALPSFEEFVGPTGVLSRVKDINRFAFTVNYQKNGAINQPVAQDALISDGYAALNDLLETSGLHNLHMLESKIRASDRLSSGLSDNEGPVIEFAFGHDIQHCRFQFYDSSFVILRNSSSFADFYSWYCIIMPEALRLEMTFREIIARATGRTLRPVQSIYDFRFYFSDFKIPDELRRLRRLQPDRQSRNMDVLESIIREFPGPDKVVRLSDQDFYRIDLTVSRREMFEGGITRNTWYFLEAPFNEGGRFIELTAQLRNTSAEILKDGEVLGVSSFDPDFGHDYHIALIEFLRERVMERVMGQLLGNWEFETARGL